MLSIVQDYLDLDGQPVVYYKNKYTKFNLFPRKVFIGKGSPAEIKWAKQRSSREIGIDCSGLVSNIISSVQPVRTILKTPRRKPIDKLRFFLRPIPNIDVPLLINPINARKVSKLELIRKWDLIHIGREHIMIVINKSEHGLKYVHASETANKVEMGEIRFTNVDKTLGEQAWTNLIYQKRFQSTQPSGVVRLTRLGIFK